MFGRQEEGMYRAQKKVNTHARTGVAGKMNCEETGRRMAMRYAEGMKIWKNREGIR